MDAEVEVVVVETLVFAVEALTGGTLVEFFAPVKEKQMRQRRVKICIMTGVP